MNPVNGYTSGRAEGWHWQAPLVSKDDIDVCKHCPRADRMRLRRLPRWVWFGTSRKDERNLRRLDIELCDWPIRHHRMTKKRLKAWQHEAARQSATGMLSIPF